MNEQTQKQRLFDISEYSEKVRESLKKLEQTQKPGEQTGKGSKTVVLESVKSEIQELLKNGYTTKQIADALSNDVFGIIPKTITQLINGKEIGKKTKSKTKKIPTSNTQSPTLYADKKQKNQTENKPLTQLDDVE